MATELRAETVRKKLLACETLPEFLARMTVVWEERQRRLAEAPARAVEATRRAQAKIDREAFKARRRAAAARYAALHPDRIKESQRRRSEALSEARALERQKKAAVKAFEKLRQSAERDAKRANRAEGYPKHQPKSPKRSEVVSAPWRGPVDSLSRVWFGPATEEAARPDNRGSPALCTVHD